MSIGGIPSQEEDGGHMNQSPQKEARTGYDIAEEEDYSSNDGDKDLPVVHIKLDEQ